MKRPAKRRASAVSRAPRRGLGALLVYGAGGHGQVVAEAAQAQGWKVVAFLDDGGAAHRTVADLPVIRASEGLRSHARAAVIVAIGDNPARRRVQNELIAAGRRLATVVHPSAWLSPSARVGAGVYVGPHACINAEAGLGDGVVINTAAVVEHHNRIGAFAHIGPRAALAGRVIVGELTLIGVGATVRPGITIGASATVGAGAAVVKDVAEGQTVVGIPARPKGL